MSSRQIHTIAGDEVCLASPSAEPDLLRATNLSFRQWLAPSSQPAKDIVFEGTLCVDGYMAGQVHSDEGKLILGTGATIDGDIFVREALVNGIVRGDIHGTQRVELGSSARVIGDIQTAELVIHPGATFHGSCALASATGARDAA